MYHEPSHRKKVPNPFGSRGSPAHVRRIHEAAWLLGLKHNLRLLAGGPKPEFAVAVGTVLGKVKFRRPDLILFKEGLGFIAVQVGRVTKAGLPVARELRALRDLRRTGLFKHVFFLRYIP